MYLVTCKLVKLLANRNSVQMLTSLTESGKLYPFKGFTNLLDYSEKQIILPLLKETGYSFIHSWQIFLFVCLFFPILKHPWRNLQSLMYYKGLLTFVRHGKVFYQNPSSTLYFISSKIVEGLNVLKSFLLL